MKTAIINIKPGQTVAYHGEPCIVLEHRADGTLLMAANAIEYKFGSGNNFAASALRMHLNANYLDTLTEGHPDEIITRTVDLTALNGSKEFGTCDCKVAPLTLDELRKYHGIIPKPEAGSGPSHLGAPPAWMEIIPGSWACSLTAMSAATTAPIPTGPAPLSSSPPSMPWRLMAAWTSTPPMS